MVELKRIPYFDNARALLIILVVLGHMSSEFIEHDELIADVYLFIYTFHMPAFILISGYFAKKFMNRDILKNL